MRLGFLSACMADRGLDEVVGFAAANGFRAVELGAWPTSVREHTATHLDVTSDEAVERAGELLSEHGITASALAFYENNLDPLPEVRAAYHEHLRHCLDAAARIGIPAVGTFIGRNPERSISESMREAEEAFAPLVEYAGERGVALMIENCVMERWDLDRQVGNLAHTPELWEWLGSIGLGLNFDPAHLIWLGIDPVAALDGAMPIVRHVHAKDIELFAERRNRTGWGGSLFEPDHKQARWWRFRMPGMGEVDFRAMLALLHERGYEGTVSIEHEDPVWEGDPERVNAGLRFGRATLARMLPEAL